LEGEKKMKGATGKKKSHARALGRNATKKVHQEGKEKERGFSNDRTRPGRLAGGGGRKRSANVTKRKRKIGRKGSDNGRSDE